jgi:hypothetical protein
VSVMDNEKQPSKRATRLADFFGGSGDMVDFELPSSKAIPPEKDPVSNLSKPDKEDKTFHRPPPDRKVPQVLKLSKKVAFADLPVIVENRETEVGPKEYVEQKEVVTSQQHDQFKNSHLARHFEAYYKITLGRNEDIPVCRIKSAAFQEDSAAIQKGAEVLDERQTCVLLWPPSGSDDSIPNPTDDQVKIIKKIVDKRFVRGMGAYEMLPSREPTLAYEKPPPREFTLAYEFMPVSLAEVAASRKIRGSELAYILKQILGGLLYLEELDMGNAELNCSNVLLDTAGEVKIWGQHFCSRGKTDNLVAGFWRITVELMNGYLRKDGQERLDYTKWTAYPEAVDFYECLETLNNATGDKVRLLPSKSRTRPSRFQTIVEHPFWATACSPREVGALTQLVQYTNRWIVSYNEVF